jgi:hypothetical protein
VEKMFSLMGYDFFGEGADTYHVSSHFFRIEFQQRGAPHVHSLLWLKNRGNKDAPNFWVNPENPKVFETKDQTNRKKAERKESLRRHDKSIEENHDQNKENETKLIQDKRRMEEIEKFADLLITTSPEDICCEKHDEPLNEHEDQILCNVCENLREKVRKYQNHRHTFTCAKKKKTITIKEGEGHGRLSGHMKGPELRNIPVCRFRFPRFPMDETKLILGISKDADEILIKDYKKDLNKIINFLIRQTYCEKIQNENESWERLKNMNFWEFLHAVGKFVEEKCIHDYSNEEKEVAKKKVFKCLICICSRDCYGCYEEKGQRHFC